MDSYRLCYIVVGYPYIFYRLEFVATSSDACTLLAYTALAYLFFHCTVYVIFFISRPFCSSPITLTGGVTALFNKYQLAA